MTGGGESLTLPAALAGWSHELSSFEHGVAIALGPLIHRLDELVGRHASARATAGVPDGFDGITDRGHPDRLLMSQWLLAQEVPLEFARRAAEGELLYLAPARQHDSERGQSVLLLDCGPRLQGAPRLVQLALAIVLHRRARSAERGFGLGILTDEPGTWLDGDLATQLGRWLRSRTSTVCRPQQVTDWLGQLDRPQDAWVVTTESALREVDPPPGTRPRFVTVHEAEWTSSGPTRLVVSVAGEHLQLPLPDARPAIQVLRGQGWRRSTPARVVIPAPELRHPTLHGFAPVLLARGPDAHEIVQQQIPLDEAPAPRSRRHRVAGQVVAASVIGRRLVVLAVHNGVLTVHVVGKHLAAVHRIVVPIDDLGLDDAELARTVDDALAPVFFRRGSLLVPLAGTWWEVSPDDAPRPRPDIAAVLASPVTDQPHQASVLHGQVWIDSLRINTPAAPAWDQGIETGVVMGAEAVAWRSGHEEWRLTDLAAATGTPPGRAFGDGEAVPVPHGTQVLGIVRTDGAARLVLLSPGGLLVRLATSQGTTTLTRWSGGTSPPAVHSRYPFLAVRRGDGAVEVGNLDTGRVQLRWEPS